MENSPDAVDDSQERKRLYEKRREDLFKLQISNSENLDKAVLTYSGAGLALSLGFLKDFIPIADAKMPWALYGSWICFTSAIALVIFSYVISARVVEAQLDQAERYYVLGQDDAYTEKTLLRWLAKHLNSWIYAAVFVVALILTIVFVSMNLKGATMAGKNFPVTYAQDGAIAMSMQKVPVQRGITGMPMHSVSSPRPASSVPAPQAQPASAAKTKG
ncbi:hypothetical protein [Cupriavidus plantarum]|uniref:hypothetical protein n=1 Tax=Cupriavidus plantarum TaxID=942865 RepID=UPI000E2287AB|nr:hypothetical protein [Cupriavidus plantarum]REF03036.1 hypothetical protein C7418_1859 [Cupriavidus plantarum]RLK44098.1 hypothetical protein C7417_0074 [Cupriavidus plantarum]